MQIIPFLPVIIKRLKKLRVHMESYIQFMKFYIKFTLAKMGQSVEALHHPRRFYRRSSFLFSIFIFYNFIAISGFLILFQYNYFVKIQSY